MAAANAAASRVLVRAFKQRGLGLKADAVTALLSVLSREEDVDGALEAILDAIKGLIERGELKSSLVDVGTVEAVVLQLTRDEEDLDQESIAVMDAFSQPKMGYDPHSKAFSFSFDSKRPMNPPASARARMFRERYQLVQQRVLRHELFTRPILGHDRQWLKLETVDSLLGTRGEKTLLGVITQVEEGRYYLEDLTGHIPLDLREAPLEDLYGIFTENAIVLVGGEVGDAGAFKVMQMGWPPPEPRAETLRHLRSLELLGKGFTPQQYEDLAIMEKQAGQQTMVVVLADLHLDRPNILEKLRTLFGGYEGVCSDGATLLFVIMGNFTSKPVAHGHEGREQLLGYFEALASLLKTEAPSLCAQATFIIVPGPHDPGAGAVLPRGPLPAALTRPLAAVLQKAHFTSNPCRLRLFTQEVTIFREDVLKKMLRHAVVQGCPEDPEKADPLMECLVQSLLDQGHLCPLPLKARPIAWEYDHALRLYPLPDVLILADNSYSFTHEYFGCQVLSPGCFPVDDTFTVYHPHDRTAEKSALPH